MPVGPLEITRNADSGRSEAYAPEASDMLERVPSRLMKWGTFSIISVVGLLLLIAVLVRYPDTLEGRAVITTDPMPIQLKAQASGRIAQLMVRENTLIAKDAVVVEIENNTGLQNIQILERNVNSILDALQRSDLVALHRFSNYNLQMLGEGQTAYNQLLQNISAYLLIKQQRIFNKRVDNIHLQNGEYHKLSAISKEETALICEEIKQANERFKANEKLYEEKIISRQEYYEEAAKLRQKQLTLEQQKRSKVQSNISISENSKQLFELAYNKEEKENSLILSIQEQVRNLQNFITVWRKQYLVIAPYSGRIFYTKPLQANEQVTAGDPLFSVVPGKFHYLAYILVSAAGLGKIKNGQMVHLLLDHFPYNEYGYVEGFVSSVSVIPEDTRNSQDKNVATYRVFVRLADSLITNCHNRISFSPEMSGTARIITKDRNLLQRLFAFVAKIDK